MIIISINNVLTVKFHSLSFSNNKERITILCLLQVEYKAKREHFIMLKLKHFLYTMNLFIPDYLARISGQLAPQSVATPQLDLNQRPGLQGIAVPRISEVLAQRMALAMAEMIYLYHQVGFVQPWFHVILPI